MCGIAGILDLSGGRPVEAAELTAMAATLAHRGPDDQGCYVDPAGGVCGLAHRRLSIIDPAGGHQPMADKSQTIWICYNGEVYNFPELRRRLQAAGYVFRSRSDTEVLIHLYRQYGPACVDHLRGMFAFAIWDSPRRQLFLARDRLGQKPLYYCLQDGRFRFASECKALLHSRRIERRIDPESILYYLLLQYVPHPRSGFAGIRQLPPGHTLTVTPQDRSEPSSRAYWRLPTEETWPGSWQSAEERLRQELQQAVEMRMISDVPLGAFLSGGLDSTIIVGLMSEVSAEPIRTCAIGFEPELYNELPYARLAAERFGCDHVENMVRPDAPEAIEKLSYFYDEPFADSSALPTWYLAQAARERVTVALSGDGGDECFGGYDRYRAMYLAERIRRSRLLRFLARRRLWRRLAADEHHGRIFRLQRLLDGCQRPPGRRYLQWCSLFDPDFLAQIVDPQFGRELPEAESLWGLLDDCFGGDRPEPDDPAWGAARAMVADGRFYLPGDINTKVDRASMAVGLEVRSPFQDHKVVELAFSLPTRWRHDGRTSKRILRQACKDLLPGRIARRAKMGFGVPVGRWFRGPLRDLFRQTVFSRRARQRGMFRPEALERLAAEHEAHRADHGHRMWALLMLELWQRRYVDGA